MSLSRDWGTNSQTVPLTSAFEQGCLCNYVCEVCLPVNTKFMQLNFD